MSDIDTAAIKAEIRACLSLDSWGRFQEKANQLSESASEITWAEFQLASKDLAVEVNRLGMWYAEAQKKIAELVFEMEYNSDEADRAGDALASVQLEAGEDREGAMARIRTIADDVLKPRVIASDPLPVVGERVR